MGKIAFLLLAVVVALVWLKLKARGGIARKPEHRREAAVERMIECAHCSIHVPAAEAVFDARGKAYCCGAHADARTGGP